MTVDPRLIPITKASETNKAFTSGANVLTTALSPSFSPTLFRIMVATDTAALFKANVIVSSTERTVTFNSGQDLVADAVYMFDLLVHSGDTVNFELDDSGNLILFRVQEIAGGTQ